MLLYYMHKSCKISIKNFEIIVSLKNSITADLIWSSLPIFSEIKTWGEEVYFYTEIQANLESDARDIIEFGEIAYWPSGKAIAIGYGKTPLSLKDEIRLASRCNVWGKTLFNLKKLKDLRDGENISIEKVL